MPTSQTSAAAQSAEPKPLPGHPKIATKPSHHRAAAQSENNQSGSFTRAAAAAPERQAKRRQRAAHRKLARQAGKAAPFLVPVGDNSVPTYGSEASTSQLAAASSALAAYLAARAAGEWAAACAQMSAQVQKQITVLTGGTGEKQADCPQSYATVAEHGSSAARANPLTHGLTALRVESPHAFALFSGPGEQQYVMPMQEEEGGAWKVDQIAAIPWPVGAPTGG